MTDRRRVEQWVDAYERAWRRPGTDGLDELFSEEVSYRPSPWAQAIRGVVALRRFWEQARVNDAEGFVMTSDVVAVEGATAVVRVAVEYGDGERWRDLWIVTFDAAGRCAVFEEWPFRPEQSDGHELDPTGDPA